jgi:tetratricopeptide (TPR) repeat protein
MRPDERSAAILFIANASLHGHVARVLVATPRGSHEGALARVSLGGGDSLALVGPSGMAGIDDRNIDLSDAIAITVLLADGSRKTFGEDPTQRYLAAQQRFGALYTAKQFDEALPVADELVSIARGALQGSPSHLAGALSNRAELQRLLGMPLAAAAALREVVPLMERAFGRDHANTRQTLRSLGNALADAGAFEEALAVFHDLLPRTERAAPNTMEHARDQASVAAVGVQAGDQHLEASVPFLHAAIAIAMRASPARLAVGHWWKMLGDIIVRLGAEGANGCYLVAHDYLEAELGPHHAQTLAVKRLLEPASR